MKKAIQIGTALAVVLLLLAACGKKTKTNGEDNTMKIRHISFGNGEKTMVVVPGLSIGYVTDNAQAIETAFSDFTDDYTVYLFDIREDVPRDYTITQMGEDLAAAIKELGLKDIYLYGCSMGGMQSLYVAGTYPELVSKVAVCSSACKANDTANAVVENWIRLAKEGSCHELTASMGQLIYSPVVYEASKEAFAAMADGLTEETLNRFIHTASVIPGMDLTKEAAAVKCPVFVLGAKGDRVLTAEASAQIAEVTGGTLYLYGAEYPHAVYDEAPDLRDRVKAFFD